MTERKRILIVEDEPIPAEYAKELLELNGYEIVGMADSYEQGIDLFRNTESDLIICDIRIKGNRSGIDLIRDIRNERPFKLIYLTAFGDEQNLKQAATTQPNHYILKPYRDSQLLASVELVFLEEQNQTPEIKEKSTAYNELGEREKEIISELLEGKSSSQIAEKLYISKHTVDTHRRNILLKMDFSNTMELTLFLLKNRIGY